MKTGYAVEIHNRYEDDLVERMGMFKTCEEAEQYAREMDVDIDRSCEHVEITGVEYEEGEEDVSCLWKDI